AIREMHDVGIVHMDLKPSNILIDEHGHLVVCDFGLSHEVPTYVPKHDYSEYLHRDNFSGQIGTIAYTAPEVITHTFYNCKVDTWSLGMILLEMYMG
ncbi:kinase-like protein, partial [Stereum hirsutum FP-91666 SS1]|uniref:kinase-like protein n=1 Tax=Stereum hirsutum (strain FP-91666) TaxID=721885 RepID=UPI00044495A7